MGRSWLGNSIGEEEDTVYFKHSFVCKLRRGLGFVSPSTWALVRRQTQETGQELCADPLVVWSPSTRPGLDAQHSVHRAQSCDPGTKEGKAGGSDRQGYLWIITSLRKAKATWKKNVKKKQDFYPGTDWECEAQRTAQLATEGPRRRRGGGGGHGAWRFLFDLEEN